MDARDKTPLTLGHHSCPRALRELSEAPETDRAARPLRLVIPPVTPELVGTLDALLDRISQRADVVLVLNDFGALSRCAARKKSGALSAALCLGALLSGQDTDPVLESWTCPQPDRVVADEDGFLRLRWAPPPETLMAHWRRPSAWHWAPLLRALGVEEIELCRQPLGPPLDLPGFRVTCLPYAILSVLPCGGDCARCGAKPMERCGKPLRWDRNLLLVPPSP